MMDSLHTGSDTNGIRAGGDAYADARMVDVVLEGGPADLPSEMRLDRAEVANSVLKIQRGAGYEHFECLDAGHSPEECERLSFRWIFRTKIAE
jgi:hypothetical protein